MKFKSLLHDNIFSKKVLAFVVWLSWFPLVQTKKENDKFCLLTPYQNIQQQQKTAFMTQWNLIHGKQCCVLG